MAIIGGLILVLLIGWIVSRITGSKGAGVAAGALTGVALIMLNSGEHHHHHKRLDYDA